MHLPDAPSWHSLVRSSWHAWPSVRHALHLAARHTGVPAVVVAAVVLVVSWRLVRRAWRLALEVCVCATLLAALTEMHLLTW